jgi:hypothetical protein
VLILGIAALAITLIFGFLRAPRDRTGRRPMLSCYVIVLIGFSLYVAFPTALIFTSGTYTWAPDYYSEQSFANAVWLCVIALVAFLYGNFLSRRRNPPDPTAVDEIDSSPHDAHQISTPTENLLLYSFLALGLALKLYLIISTGGVEHSVARFSGYARQFSGVDTLDAGGMLLRTVSGIGDGAAAWGVLRALRTRQREATWILILLATLGLSYLTISKRLVLILPIVCVLVGVHVYRRSLTIRLLPLMLAIAVGIGFITLSARVFLPASVAGYNINLNNVAYAHGSALQFYFYSLEFSSVEMISVAMQSRSDIMGLFGGTWDATMMTNFEPFLYSVPRALWPGKPESFYDLSYGISAILGATPFEDPTVGYASTVVGTSFLLGGVVGVIVAMLALGFFTARLDRRLARGQWTDMSIVLYALALVVVFHLFRQGTLGWTFIVAVVQQYGAIAALLTLSYASSRALRRASNSETNAPRQLVT